MGVSGQEVGTVVNVASGGKWPAPAKYLLLLLVPKTEALEVAKLISGVLMEMTVNLFFRILNDWRSSRKPVVRKLTFTTHGFPVWQDILPC